MSRELSALAVWTAMISVATLAAADPPAIALVGTPCFCARVCQDRGVTYSAWTDPAGERLPLSVCPPADPHDIAGSGTLCTCHDPLDWYRIWNELKPSPPPEPPYPGP